jgi:hypothetical protein
VPRRFATTAPAACALHASSRGCVAAGTRLGTKLRFTLSARARVSVTVWTRVKGRRHVVSTFVRSGAAGANILRFAGRAHGLPLASGAYGVTVVAGRGARASLPASLRLAVRNR